jgi:hypothetical protein
MAALGAFVEAYEQLGGKAGAVFRGQPQRLGL